MTLHDILRVVADPDRHYPLCLGREGKLREVESVAVHYNDDGGTFVTLSTTPVSVHDENED